MENYSVRLAEHNKVLKSQDICFNLLYQITTNFTPEKRPSIGFKFMI